MGEADGTESVSASMYHVDANNPQRALIDTSAYDPAEVAEISAVMAALGRLREAERALLRASQEYMKLSETDMRAIHFVIVSGNKGVVATPSAIAAHLEISTASVTKLLDRLERGGHVLRHAHPSDRRALAITVTDKTRQAATDSMGRHQSRRFYAAARLTSEERGVVVRFLDDMTNEISGGAEEDGTREGGS